MSRRVNFTVTKDQLAEIEQAINDLPHPEVRQRAIAIRVLHSDDKSETIECSSRLQMSLICRCSPNPTKKKYLVEAQGVYRVSIDPKRRSTEVLRKVDSLDGILAHFFSDRVRYEIGMKGGEFKGG